MLNSFWTVAQLLKDRTQNKTRTLDYLCTLASAFYAAYMCTHGHILFFKHRKLYFGSMRLVNSVSQQALLYENSLQKPRISK